MNGKRFVSEETLLTEIESAYQRGLNDGQRQGFVLGAAWSKELYFGERIDADSEANRRWPK